MPHRFRFILSVCLLFVEIKTESNILWLFCAVRYLWISTYLNDFHGIGEFRSLDFCDLIQSMHDEECCKRRQTSLASLLITKTCTFFVVEHVERATLIDGSDAIESEIL